MCILSFVATGEDRYPPSTTDADPSLSRAAIFVFCNELSPCCSGLDENMFTLRAEARANSLRVNARGSGRPGNTAHSCVQPNADYYAVVVKLFSRLAQRCK
ncbi:hypothetical protein F2P81_013205 [Scophthalmus maximus]|uniref:Uncharacterized protein n=1 Tax=Scophthalmus maximus TaxID=52904 RepID=A0A6A4SQ53_SCOMX|nr:hypothetical protein F2P81_013205 [Scophthalmus maximus]